MPLKHLSSPTECPRIDPFQKYYSDKKRGRREYKTGCCLAQLLTRFYHGFRQQTARKTIRRGRRTSRMHMPRPPDAAAHYRPTNTSELNRQLLLQLRQRMHQMTKAPSQRGNGKIAKAWSKTMDAFNMSDLYGTTRKCPKGKNNKKRSK